ncbi:MAG: phosphatase PAP2 family protein [Clostridiales bacterium]|nr:phosphatase PAP2 family protein [Candidatus Equinaster intestinalis]
MKREFYEKLNKTVRNKGLEKVLRIVNNSVTLAVFIFYPTLLVLLALTDYEDIFKMVIVPLSAFIVLSIARYFINAARPYEIMDIKPLASNIKKGKSFPSRHAFSIFMIAFCSLHFNIPLGVFLLVIAVLLAALRVACGVHYIKDVVAGAIFAVAAYLIGFICF